MFLETFDFVFELNCSLRFTLYSKLVVTFPRLNNNFSGFFLADEAGLRGISENLFFLLLFVNSSLKFCVKFERKTVFNVKCLLIVKLYIVCLAALVEMHGTTLRSRQKHRNP